MKQHYDERKESAPKTHDSRLIRDTYLGEL